MRVGDALLCPLMFGFCSRFFGVVREVGGVVGVLVGGWGGVGEAGEGSGTEKKIQAFSV